MKSEQIVAAILKQVQERINSEEFLNEHRIGNAFTRSGKLPFKTLVYYALQATHKSISINYAILRESLSAEKLPFVSKQAISKARQGISYKRMYIQPCNWQ